MPEHHYVVATLRPWHVRQYHARVARLPGVWHLIDRPEELTFERLESIEPRFVFFPHWSHKVPKEVIEAFECVCFHETDVPYGRGGSPIQNLIARRHKETVVSALRMVEALDAGPVYAKQPLSLQGLAEEIYVRTASIVFDMMEEIVANEPEPVPQMGEPVVFKRRTPQESVLPGDGASLEALFDHIRMLDAQGYPHAFLDYGKFRIELTRPALRTDHLEANVRISLKPD